MSPSTLALSCVAKDIETLQESYERSSAIIVYKAVACADGGDPTDGFCKDSHYSMVEVETLKGGQAVSRPSFTYHAGNDINRCGEYAKIGHELLFFFNENGVDTHTVLSLEGNSYKTQNAKSLRSRLAKYRVGSIPDLSEPWVFTDNLFFCGLQQNLGKGSFKFSVFYGEEGIFEAIDIASSLTNEGQFKSELSWKEGADRQSEADSIKVDKIARSNTENRPIYFSLKFFVPYQAEINDTGSVVISVDEQSFPLNTQHETISSSHDSFEYVYHTLQGDAAERLFAAIRTAEIVTVATTRDLKSVIDATAAQFSIVLTTRLTYLDDALQAFNLCRDGSVRNPPFILVREQDSD